MEKMKKIAYLLIFISIASYGSRMNKASQINQGLELKIQHLQNKITELENTNSKLREEINGIIHSFLNLTQGEESHLFCKITANVPIVKKPLKIIKKVMPDNHWLRYARMEGNVILEVIIDTKGNVIRLRHIAGHALLKGYAIRAVLQWKFEPVIINGKATPARFCVVVPFRLYERT